MPLLTFKEVPGVVVTFQMSSDRGRHTLSAAPAGSLIPTIWLAETEEQTNNSVDRARAIPSFITPPASMSLSEESDNRDPSHAARRTEQPGLSLPELLLIPNPY